MIDNSKLKTMLEGTVDLQNSLNVYTCGEDWTSGKTDKGRNISWFRATYLECAEAINSAQWKWWKSLDTPDDVENVKMEICDIYHFILSILISSKGIEATKNYVTLYLNPENQGDKFCGLEKLMLLSLECNQNAISLLQAFSIALGNWGMTLEDLVSTYVIKNTLNTWKCFKVIINSTYIVDFPFFICQFLFIIAHSASHF